MAPCDAGVGAVEAVPAGGTPRGLATVAPAAADAVVAVVLLAPGVAAEAVACGKPSGFATVASCGVDGVVAWAIEVAAVPVVVAVCNRLRGFATVAPCGADVVADVVAGAVTGVTVADSTLVVTFGAPAVEIAGAWFVVVVALAAAGLGLASGLVPVVATLTGLPAPMGATVMLGAPGAAGPTDTSKPAGFDATLVADLPEV